MIFILKLFFGRVSGVHVPMWRRSVSTRVRAVQRRGNMRRQVRRIGRPVRRRWRRGADRRGEQQDVCPAAATAAAAYPGPGRLPARPGRVPVPV